MSQKKSKLLKKYLQEHNLLKKGTRVDTFTGEKNITHFLSAEKAGKAIYKNANWKTKTQLSNVFKIRKVLK
jgi:hypothetical protein